MIKKWINNFLLCFFLVISLALTGCTYELEPSYDEYVQQENILEETEDEEQDNHPDEGQIAYVVSCVEATLHVLETEVETEPEPADCCFAVYFSTDFMDPESVKGEGLIEKGVAAGGCVEVFQTEDEAIDRASKLQQAGEKGTVIGNSVLRLSERLTSDETFELEIELLFNLSEGEFGDTGYIQSELGETPIDSDEEDIVETYKPLRLSEIPDYSNKPYVVVNDNIPNFSKKELTTKAYEYYSPLDSLGRCGVALASCGQEIMPAKGEERGNISSIKPTGWIQKKYKGVSGGYLWNRCHLIGWQLSAENANRNNLITGTRYMNVEGMLPFENMVADYIRETDNHVAYRITPVYKKNNLVCHGVQMEAYSVEDDGEGICFNVFCYNVQPGIDIKYSTGDSTGPEADTSSKVAASKEHHDGSAGELVWIPRTGSKYHCNEHCSGMINPSKVTKEEAEERGYEPCAKCYR